MSFGQQAQSTPFGSGTGLRTADTRPWGEFDDDGLLRRRIPSPDRPWDSPEYDDPTPEGDPLRPHRRPPGLYPVGWEPPEWWGWGDNWR